MLYKRLKGQLNFIGLLLVIIFILILGAFLYNYYLTGEINARQDELINLSSAIAPYSDYAADYIGGRVVGSEIPTIAQCELCLFLANKIPRNDELGHYAAVVLQHEEFHKSLLEEDRVGAMGASQRLNRALQRYNGYLVSVLGQMQRLRTQVISVVALPGLFLVMAIFIFLYIRLLKLMQARVINPLKGTLDILATHNLAGFCEEDEPKAILNATQRVARYITADDFRKKIYSFWNSVSTEEQLIKGSIELLGGSQLVSGAAFYQFKKESKELDLVSSYAFPKEGKKKILYGEGPIGEAANTGRYIIIEKPKLEINLGFGSVEPAFLGCFPIGISQLFGVLALTSTEESTLEEMEDMEILASQIAIVLDRIHQLEFLRQLTEELKASTKNLNKELLYKDSILNSSADGIAILSSEGIIKLFSKGAEEITGFTAEEAVGSNCCDIFRHLDESLNQMCNTELCANYFINTQQASISGKELYISNKSGQRVPVLFSAAPLYNDEGKIIEILQIFKDVTELKKTLAQLEEASRSKTEFLSTMSHELRTPLNAVLGFAELLELENIGPLNEKQKKYTTNILTAGKHLLSLINDLLDISKIESGKMKWELEPVDIPQLFGGTISLLREKATQSQLTISLEIEEGYQNFIGDERKMKQILFNLVNNAIKFTPSGGKVGIEVSRSEKGMSISVWDTGIGIPENKRESVFEPFFRVDDMTVKGQQGTGLGLPLVKKMVELPGGQIWLEEGEAGGTVIKVYLPDGKKETHN